jgi:type VI secretion system secreted protein VgrG
MAAVGMASNATTTNASDGAASPAPAGAADMNKKTAAEKEQKELKDAAKTGLGNDVDKLAAKSPSMQKDLKALDEKKWDIKYGDPGKGSKIDREKGIIYIDGNLKDDPKGATQALSHEIGHANYQLNSDYSSKSTYLNGTLSDEGAATMNNIKVQREIVANGGPDIGIAGNPANQPAYNAAYDQYLKDGDTAKAQQTIGNIFGQGEKTSTTGQTYSDYYGGWYDKNYSGK